MWLGIDLGTQGVRASLVSENGCVLGRSSQPLTSRRDDGRHEQNPEQWWRATVAACRQALTGVPARGLKGVAVDGTSGTIVLVDTSGRPLSAGLMYDDSRAQAEAQKVNEAGIDMWDSLGYRMQASWALPKLIWLIREFRGVVRGVRLVHQVDFINRRLAGCEVASDWSNALKTGYDLINERWPYELLDSLGVPGHMLPAVVEPGTQLGVVCQETEEMTGIPAGTPIMAGLTDGCAAQIGAGALDEGSWNLVLGTTLIVKGVTAKPSRDAAGMVYSHRLPERKWAPGGASNAGAGAIAQRFPSSEWQRLSTQATSQGPTDVLAYPLVSRGERFPFSAPQAEGFVIGQPCDDVELYTALMQGAGFVARLCFDYLVALGASVHEITITGGATRSRHWCQLSADILRCPVRLPENAEPAFGMAVLAASRERSLSQVAKQMVRMCEVFDPRPRGAASYVELYVRMVNELERRGWLPLEVAGFARRRSSQNAA